MRCSPATRVHGGGDGGHWPDLHREGRDEGEGKMSEGSSRGSGWLALIFHARAQREGGPAAAPAAAMAPRRRAGEGGDVGRWEGKGAGVLWAEGFLPRAFFRTFPFSVLFLLSFSVHFIQLANHFFIKCESCPIIIVTYYCTATKMLGVK